VAFLKVMYAVSLTSASCILYCIQHRVKRVEGVNWSLWAQGTTTPSGRAHRRCAASEIRVVLVAAFDRVARSVKHFLQAMDESDALGITFISLARIWTQAVLRGAGRDRELFVRALLNPPAPSARMKAAAQRYKKHYVEIWHQGECVIAIRCNGARKDPVI
jgi:Resolvase, N terminal domain